MQFLSYAIYDTASPESSRAQRLVLSIGQDICRAATNGEWKLPKHVLICMTLRHLFRSEKLITFFNRMGHCESYSFSLELETALAKAIEETSSVLSTSIIRNPDAPSVFHSEFDNFDQLTNDLTGMGSVHTAHGIMMQDIEGDPQQFGGSRPKLALVERSRERSFQIDSNDDLPECFVTKQKSPCLVIKQWAYPESEAAFNMAKLRIFLWIFLRIKCGSAHQSVPGWAGFISRTGSVPQSLTTIDYYPVITHPITDYKTVQECLKYAEMATDEVKQQYVITTFDLGVCMRAFPLIWNNPRRYEKHFIMIGTFHIICAYFKMVGEKMKDQVCRMFC